MPGQPRSRFRPLRALLALLLAAQFVPARVARAADVVEEAAGPSALLDLGRGEMAVLSLPPGGTGPGLWPVAVMLPDADGAGPRNATYARRLLENGVAVVEAYFDAADEGAPRQPIPLDQRLGLVLAAMDGHARLDRQRLAVIGMGQGARAAMLGLPGQGPVAGLVLLYPGCDAALAGAAALVPGAPRVLLLHGDEDPANDAGDCAALAGAFPAQGAVRHRVLTGASYGWDATGMVRPGGVALLADPAGQGRRIWSQPDPLTTQVAADRMLGLVVAALGGR